MVNSECVFIDTGFFKAIVDTSDDFHEKAQSVLEQLKSESVVLVTTNYVLDESFTLIRVRCGVEVVDSFRKYLADSSPVFKIVRVIVADEAAAWKWFLSNWSGLSFTDCISFSVMKRLGVSRVATFDKHFLRAGFEVEK